MGIFFGANRNEAANSASDQVTRLRAEVDQLQGALGTANANVDVTTGRATAAESRVAQLQKQLADVSSPPGNKGGASSGASSEVLPDGVTVRRTTGARALSIRPGYGINMDDENSPNWQLENWPMGSGGDYNNIDIQLNEDKTISFRKDVAVESGTVSYATCAGETAYSQEKLDLAKLHKGDTMRVIQNLSSR